MDDMVLAALSGVEDPELGVNIVDLGLVYQAERDAETVRVRMTATSRSCPLGEYLQEEARSRLASAFKGRAIDVELVWTPAWTPERVSEQGRAELM